MENLRLPKCVMFGELVGGAGCVRDQEREWMVVFPGQQPQSFRYQRRDHWTIAAQDEEESRKTTELGAEHFMSKWIAAQKARVGLRHAVVCPNVTRRTKERIAQKASGLVLVRSPQLIDY